jgi:hypothetical protein
MAAVAHALKYPRFLSRIDGALPGEILSLRDNLLGR